MTDARISHPVNYTPHMDDGGSDYSQHALPNATFSSSYATTAQENDATVNSGLGLLPSPVEFGQRNPAIVSCSCQQDILRESFKLSLTYNGQPIALDQALSNNQDVAAICSSALSCPYHQYFPDDLTFFLTLVSLLIRAADILNAVGEACRRSLNSTSRPGSHGEDSASSLLNAGDFYEVSSAGCHSAPLTPQSMNATICAMQPTPPQALATGVANVAEPAQPIFSEYKWSDMTEDAMQEDMLRMEVSKLQNLADNLEHRFARSTATFAALRDSLPTEWGAAGHSTDREQLYGGGIEDQAHIVSLLLIDLKKRIQPNRDTFRAR